MRANTGDAAQPTGLPGFSVCLRGEGGGRQIGRQRCQTDTQRYQFAGSQSGCQLPSLCPSFPCDRDAHKPLLSDSQRTVRNSPYVRRVFHSIQSLYIPILPVSALAVLPDFHRVDGLSK